MYPSINWNHSFAIIAYIFLPLLPFIAFLIWRAPTCCMPDASLFGVGSHGAREDLCHCIMRLCQVVSLVSPNTQE